MAPPVIIWFRRDLRLSDHPALRKYVPELIGVPGKAVHKLDRLPPEYPVPVVGHAHERRVSFDRYDAIRTA